MAIVEIKEIKVTATMAEEVLTAVEKVVPKMIHSENFDYVAGAISEFEYDFNHGGLVPLWNEYCEQNSYTDDMIYSLDEESISMFFNTPWECLEAFMKCDEVDLSDDWFKFDWDGSVNTLSNPIEGMDLESLVEWYISERL